MANDNGDTISTGLLLLGAGAAGYAAARWVVAPWLDDRRARAAKQSEPPTDSAASSLPALSPATPSAPAAQERAPAVTPLGLAAPPVQVTAAPPAPAQAEPEPPKVRRAPPRRVTGPVTSPSQLEIGPVQVYPATSQVHDGPITSPSQVSGTSGRPLPRTAPARRAATSSALSRRFDAILDRYRSAIPIEYLRALIERESGTNPNTQTHAARGLMQIVPVVLDDYNKRHGTAYQSEHLYDPAINVAIGCELLRLIIASYARNHPRIANLQMDWSNPRFVELLTFGWNAGFSEASGVGRVARYLEQQGITDLTIELVHRAAPEANASRHLANAAKVHWCKSVTTLYQRERVLSRTTL